MENAFISKLLQLAKSDPNIVYMLSDSGTGGYDNIFKHYFPNQMLNFGIAEENMLGAAAGMASVGKIPFVYAQGAFLVYRAMEFIRDDICLQNMNVKIIGSGSGLSTSSLGPTHHTTEDIGILRMMPNLLLLSPATPLQVSHCMEIAYRYKGPVYIRLGMNGEKELFDNKYTMDDLRNDVLREGNDMTIFSTGAILEEVLQASDMLMQEEISSSVLNIVQLNPFSEAIVIEYLLKTPVFITVEEHNTKCGLAGIVAETIVKNGLTAQLLSIGLGDQFADGYGTVSLVRKCNGLDALSIYKAIKRIRKSE